MIEGDGEGYEHVAGINERRWFSYYGADEFKGLLADHDLEITYHGRIRVGRRVYLNFITRRL
jgi:sugar phosphate isomerase/epimerase